MNDTSISASPPLAENEYVRELFSILQDNGRDATGLAALLGHVSEMEGFVKRAEDKIADMKSALAEMKEVQDHRVKTALQNAVKALEHKVAEVRERLSELKHNIAEGCKSAVQAFRDKGAAALSGIASFFGLKKGLQGWKNDIGGIMARDDRAIARIEAFSAEYHSAGRGLKNMGRMLIGREPIDAKKEAGKLAKALSAPYMAQKSALAGLQKSIDKAIAAIGRMEERQAGRESVQDIGQETGRGAGRETGQKTGHQAERASKPDMLGKIAKNKERVEREKLELPAPERAKTKGAEL
jgi:DNA-binding transcriptional MerR regulator